MRSVKVRVRSADLSSQMARMRIWLDDRGIRSANFSYDRNTAGVVIVTVTFENDDDAAAFASEFDGDVG
jgi:hypothetical protein